MIRPLPRLHSAAVGLLAVFCLALVGGDVQAQANAVQALIEKHFPPSEWQTARFDGGFALQCSSNSCGGGVLVTMQSGQATPEAVEKIKAGTIGEDLLKAVAAVSAARGGDFKIGKIETQKGEVPQFFMTYTCVCAGSNKHGLVKVIAINGSMIVVNTMALRPEDAVRHGGRMFDALTGKLKS